jgi:hypothetical protein
VLGAAVRYLVTLTRTRTYTIDGAQSEDHAFECAIEAWHLDDELPDIADVLIDPNFPPAEEGK